MTLKHVVANEAQADLMQAIGAAIFKQTLITPLTLDQIVGVLGYTTGCAIAKTDRSLKPRDLRQMAISNIDLGLQAMATNGGHGLVIPGKAN